MGGGAKPDRTWNLTTGKKGGTELRRTKSEKRLAASLRIRENPTTEGG